MGVLDYVMTSRKHFLHHSGWSPVGLPDKASAGLSHHVSNECDYSHNGSDLKMCIAACMAPDCSISTDIMVVFYNNHVIDMSP